LRLDPYILVFASPERPSVAAVVLRSGGYQVTRLTDPSHAAEDVHTLTPDAVVIDLPPMQAMRTVRSLEAAMPHLPVLVITAAPALVDAPSVRPGNVMMELVSAVDRLIVNSLAVAV
jgi:DNA-binding response OmpR family regulator